MERVLDASVTHADCADLGAAKLLGLEQLGNLPLCGRGVQQAEDLLGLPWPSKVQQQARRGYV